MFGGVIETLSLVSADYSVVNAWRKRVCHQSEWDLHVSESA